MPSIEPRLPAPAAHPNVREFSDPFKYPSTYVLKNIPGLRDPAALDAFEYEADALRSNHLRIQRIADTFDLAHLKAIHQQLFQDVYAWAGETRTVNISKNGTQFAQAAFIDSSMAKIAADLAEEKHLTGLDRPDFIARLAHHFAELNAVHPFREGNGRATREFLAQLAHSAGYRLDQTHIEQVTGDWVLASRLSAMGDLSAVERIFGRAVETALTHSVRTRCAGCRADSQQRSPG